MLNAKILLLPLISLLAVSCRKNASQEHEYGIVCDFPAITGDSSLLVITNQAGEVVKEFPLASGSAGLSEQFTFWTSDASEVLSVHLIERYYGSNGVHYSSEITSHVGIPATGAIRLSPEATPIVLPPVFKVIINGLDQSVEKVEQGGVFTYFEKKSPSKIICHARPAPGEGLHLKIFGADEAREMILPEVNSGDSAVLQWGQLAPTGTQELLLQLPTIPWASYSSNVRYTIRAFAGSGQQMVTLLNNFSMKPDSVLRFRPPIQLDPAWFLHVSAKNDFCHVALLFQPGATPHLALPEMRIVEANDKDEGRAITVRHTGEADMLRASTKYSASTGNLTNWQIDAAPALFEKMPIPNLDRYLPLGVKSWDIFENHFVSEAFYSEKYDYSDMTKGFPWRKSEPFSLSEGGYGWIRVR